MEGGKRGLVVVLAAFLIQVLALGNSACIGIYTVHFLQVFNNDVMGVSLISSIHVALMFGLGPVASMIMRWVPYRPLCLVGAGLISTGMFCIYLYPYHLLAVYLFFGVFCGIGGLLIYLPSHMLCGLYYEKHRTLSTGIATAGMGMGALVMPFLVGVLIEEYTWRGSFLMLSGIQLHLFVCAMFMTPPPETRSSKTSVEEPSPSHTDDDTELSLMDSYLHEHTDTDTEKELESKVHSLKENRKDDETPMILPPPGSDLTYTEDIRSPSKRIRFEATRKSRGTSVDPNDHNMEWHKEHPTSNKPSERISLSTDTRRVFLIEPDGDNNITEMCKECSNSKQDDSDTDWQKELSTSSATSQKRTTLRKSMVTLAKSHYHVLNHSKCVIYLVSTLMWSVTATLFNTFGPEHIFMQGHSEKDTAFLFAFYGLGQLLGCIVISIVGNFFGHRIFLYAATCVLTGVIMAVVPLAQSFSEFALVLTFLGFPYGGVLGLSFIVVIDFLGTEHMDVGLAYVLLANGVGCFVGPPVGALFVGHYGVYDQALFAAGIMTCASGLIVVLLYLPRCCSRKGKGS